jgi:hypothetical protein
LVARLDAVRRENAEWHQEIVNNQEVSGDAHE